MPTDSLFFSSFDFSDALVRIKSGAVVQRKGSQQVVYRVPDEDRQELVLESCTTRDMIRSWSPSTVDMWAEDWIEVPDYDIAEHRASP